LAGDTLIDAWPNMDEATKQQCVSRVVEVCKEMAIWQANSISGIDGKHLSDQYLTRFGMPENCSPQNLLNNCKSLEMDCSAFMFYHCDLGPGNIIVNGAEGLIGIIDWICSQRVDKDQVLCFKWNGFARR
jgi:hypothetical protein